MDGLAVARSQAIRDGPAHPVELPFLDGRRFEGLVGSSGPGPGSLFDSDSLAGLGRPVDPDCLVGPGGSGTRFRPGLGSHRGRLDVVGGDRALGSGPLDGSQVDA